MAVLNTIALLNLKAVPVRPLPLPPSPALTCVDASAVIAQGPGLSNVKGTPLVNYIFLYTAAAPRVLTAEAAALLTLPKNMSRLAMLHVCHYKDLVPIAARPFSPLVPHTTPVVVGRNLTSQAHAIDEDNLELVWKERVRPELRSLRYGHSVSTYDTASMSLADSELLQMRAALEWYKMQTSYPKASDLSPGSTAKLDPEAIERQNRFRFLLNAHVDEMRQSRQKYNASGTAYM